ncbi:TIGR00266 family protein [Clostridium sp. LP20]|uniref:TIGR00266 family protein n=1 Tax=Clostridium sp. LP20 TaxID=3418665 RepID=UPI003EE55FDB
MGKFEILYGNVNTVLKINAEKDDKFIVRAGAMISMADVFDMKLKSGGMKRALGRMFAGQSTFLQEYRAKEQGELVVSPSFLGDIELFDMDGSRTYRLGQNAFLASYGEIELKTKGAGGKGILSGEGLFQVEVSGEGTIALCSYGAIYKKILEPGERYVVDTNHLVLWESTIKYSVEMISNGITSLVSGEGYVCKFQGPGEIWIQTKNPSYLMTPGT